MGLSERKNKQRIGNDPRNLAWRQDSNSFGAQFLAKSGHVEGTALGSPSGSGLINPIAVSRKMDNSGIGVGRARKEGGTEAHSAGLAGVGLDDVLRRLRGEGSASPGGEKVLGGFAKAGASDLKDTIVVRDDSSASASDAGSPASETSNKPRRLAHRQRMLASKRLASSSPAAMAEILGIKADGFASPSPMPSPLGTPITSLEDDSESAAKDDLITSAKLSVGDYFQMRMAEKKRLAAEAIAAAAAGGAPSATSEPAPELIGEEEIVVVEATPVASSSRLEESASASPESSSEDEEEVVVKEKKAKKDKKEKKDKKSKRKRDEEVEEKEASSSSAPAAAEAAEDEAKARKAQEKKAKKRKEKEGAEDGDGKKKKRKKEKSE